jgi:hypothetical protein
MSNLVFYREWCPCGNSLHKLNLAEILGLSKFLVINLMRDVNWQTDGRRGTFLAEGRPFFRAFPVLFDR